MLLIVLEKDADGLAVVDAANGLRKDGGDVQVLKLGAESHVIPLRNRVGDDHLVDGRSVNTRDGVTAKNTMGQEGVDVSSALLLEQLGSSGNGVAGVDEIVDEDADLVLDIAHQHHASVALLGVLGRASLLVNQGKSHVQLISDGSSTLGTAGVGANNNSILVVGDILLNVPLDERLGVQVVNGDIEEALVLRIMKIHRDHMVRSSASQQVCNECASLGNPLLVARLGLEAVDKILVLVVVGGVAELRRDRILVGTAVAIAVTIAIDLMLAVLEVFR